jgi:peptide/nickel transport system permease protein
MSAGLDLVLDAFPATLHARPITILFLAVAVPLGVAAAARPGGVTDRLTLVIAMAGQSLPSFWIGVMLVLFLSVRHPILPAIGNASAAAYILPVITLSAVLIAVLLRTVRQAMPRPCMKLAFARRAAVPRGRILFVQPLKNAAIPLHHRP